MHDGASASKFQRTMPILIALYGTLPSVAQAAELPSSVSVTETEVAANPRPEQRPQHVHRPRGRSRQKQRRKKTAGLTVGGHLQSRLAVEGKGTEPSPSFQVRRARIDGRWQSGDWRFVSKLAVEEGKSRLLNAYAQYATSRRLQLRVGQFKRVVNFDYLGSSSAARIYERSIIGNKVDATRDIGVCLRSQWLKRKLDARLTLTNGNGAGTEGNDNRDLRYELRIDGHLGRRVRHESRKIGRAPRAMFGFGVGQVRFDENATNGAGESMWTRAQRTTFNAIGIFQVWRHELRIEYTRRQHDALDPVTGTNAPADEVASVARDGGYAQWAWRLPIKPKINVSARAQFYRRATSDEQPTFQYDGGATWVIAKRLITLSLHGWLRNPAPTAGAESTWGAISQIQLVM